jgi:UDP-2,3-diacylglucosamine pyrophosphatase LpxH
MTKPSYKTIFISDVHLGSKDCKADLLLQFLKSHKCETLYLVGDIIDAWKMQQNKLSWKQSHTNIVKKILGLSKKGVRVIYVAGNHDEFLRPMIPYAANFGNIKLCNMTCHEGIDGKRYLVIHGDLFDGISSLAPWINFLGDRAYDLVLGLNNRFNWIRHRLGFGYWSLSKYLKLKVKGAIDFIFKFEHNITDYCKRKKYDGVICGHIHNAEIKTVNGVSYMNTGDWVESCTALVEHYDGRWELLTWGAK